MPSSTARSIASVLGVGIRKRPILRGNTKNSKPPPTRLTKKSRLPTRYLARRAKRWASLGPRSSPVCRRMTAEKAKRAQTNIASHISKGGSSRKAAAKTIKAESDSNCVSSRGALRSKHFNTNRCKEKSAKMTSTSSPARERSNANKTAAMANVALTNRGNRTRPWSTGPTKTNTNTPGRNRSKLLQAKASISKAQKVVQLVAR